MIINDKRALAYIVTIDEIRPIPNYDRVEHARTNGWWCVTRLNELKVGDKAVYFEVDSKVPSDDERFSFLEAKHYKIKTQKMCKVFSQGLLMPITLFPELADMEVGTDVTDILKVTYSVVEDNTRKSKNGDPDAKYKSMAQRHQKIFKKPIVRKIMKHKLGRKIMFLFFGKKKDKPLSFPTHFPFVHKTDEERCLIGDTKVQTNNGVLRIADIVNKELPVEVLSYNEKTKTVEYKPIISYQKFAKKEDEDLIEIKYPYRFGNQKTNTIRCTPDHKFYNGSTYVRADEIHQGDKIFIHHHCYDDYVIQVVFGMLLGDSSIYYDKRSGSNNIRIQTSQGEKQLDYLKMKQSLFGEQFFKIYKCKSGYCDNVVYKGCLSADYNISKAVLENCFINNKKTITPTMLKYITPLSLAIWYMDDGNLKHKYDSCSPSIIISTCGFSKNENELLIDMLRNNFGIECNLRREKNKYWSIYITTEGTKKFLKLITQYIPPCMRYKTLQEYENDYFSIQDLRYKKQERLMPIPVISIKKYKGIRRYKTVFDIEVKDNHNFFANNILTHNCENMPWVLGYERPLIVTEKLDGTSSTYILERKGKKKFEFYVLSRNVRQKTPDQKCYHDKNIYWDMAIKNNIEQHLKEYLVANPDLKYVCIQGGVRW
jgi:intein/homing endonuclease